jgi:hypothetical protein
VFYHKTKKNHITFANFPYHHYTYPSHLSLLPSTSINGKQCGVRTGMVSFTFKFIPLLQTLGSTSHLDMSTLTHQLSMFPRQQSRVYRIHDVGNYRVDCKVAIDLVKCPMNTNIDNKSTYD